MVKHMIAEARVDAICKDPRINTIGNSRPVIAEHIRAAEAAAYERGRADEREQWNHSLRGVYEQCRKVLGDAEFDRLMSSTEGPEE